MIFSKFFVIEFLEELFTYPILHQNSKVIKHLQLLSIIYFYRALQKFLIRLIEFFYFYKNICKMS